ncbi:uncharacterized protein [Ptychodera flava]
MWTMDVPQKMNTSGGDVPPQRILEQQKAVIERHLQNRNVDPSTSALLREIHGTLGALEKSSEWSGADRDTRMSVDANNRDNQEIGMPFSEMHHTGSDNASNRDFMTGNLPPGNLSRDVGFQRTPNNGRGRFMNTQEEVGFIHHSDRNTNIFDIPGHKSIGRLREGYSGTAVRGFHRTGHKGSDCWNNPTWSQGKVSTKRKNHIGAVNPISYQMLGRHHNTEQPLPSFSDSTTLNPAPTGYGMEAKRQRIDMGPDLQPLMPGGFSQDLGVPPELYRPNEQMEINICDICGHSYIESYSTHLRSSTRHQGVIDFMKEWNMHLRDGMPQTAEEKLSCMAFKQRGGGWWCAICEVEYEDRKKLTYHLGGQRHHQMKDKLRELSSKPNEGATTEVTSATTEKKDDSTASVESKKVPSNDSRQNLSETSNKPSDPKLKYLYPEALSEDLFMPKLKLSERLKQTYKGRCCLICCNILSGNAPESHHTHSGGHREMVDTFEVVLNLTRLIHDFASVEKIEDSMKKANSIQDKLSGVEVEGHRCVTCNTANLRRKDFIEKHMRSDRHVLIRSLYRIVVKVKTAIERKNAKKIMFLLQDYKDKLECQGQGKKKWSCLICSVKHDSEEAYKKHMSRVLPSHLVKKIYIESVVDALEYLNNSDLSKVIAMVTTKDDPEQSTESKSGETCSSEKNVAEFGEQTTMCSSEKSEKNTISPSEQNVAETSEQSTTCKTGGEKGEKNTSAETKS